MIKSCSIFLAVVATALSGSAYAGDNKAVVQRVVSETDVRLVSDMTYAEILRQAFNRGWRYSPEQIESGYRRHLEELKLQFIDEGYTILAGEAGT